MNESTQPPPEEPDAMACFVEAAANLRVAEKLVSARHFDGAAANAVVYIADAWTRLGVALDNASGFDPKFPIPIRLVGDEDPEPGWKLAGLEEQVAKPMRLEHLSPSGRMDHLWSVDTARGETRCVNCARCVSHQGLGCAGGLGVPLVGTTCPVCVPAPTLKMRPDHEHGPECRHQWATQFSECDNEGCRAMPEGFYVGQSPTEVCPVGCPAFSA